MSEQKIKVEEMVIDGTTYVPKDSIAKNAEKMEGMDMVMIRTYSAGVHYGYLSKKESTLAGIEVTLKQARRCWYWSGASSLSQLSMEGTSNPDKCKFPCKVDSIDLVAIEIIPMKQKAVDSLNNVAVWKQ